MSRSYSVTRAQTASVKRKIGVFLEPTLPQGCRGSAFPLVPLHCLIPGSCVDLSGWGFRPWLSSARQVTCGNLLPLSFTHLLWKMRMQGGDPGDFSVAPGRGGGGVLSKKLRLSAAFSSPRPLLSHCCLNHFPLDCHLGHLFSGSLRRSPLCLHLPS